jgi:hypothetical protein
MRDPLKGIPMPAPERSGGLAPAIVAAILMPQDRIPREPLAAWAERLAGALEQARRSIRAPRRLAGEVEGIGNNAGLIAAHRGDLDVAWRLTEHQVWWHGRLARRSGEPTATAHAVQPWVNLGRLEALAGRWREALARFAGLGTCRVVSRLEIGCIRVGGEAWAAVTRSREEFMRLMEAVYVTDSLKAMLLNRRFELVHPFAARCEDGDGTLRWICEEACVLAECRLGDFGAAAARASGAARQAKAWNRAVLRLRAAEAHACGGEIDRAAEILAQIASVVRQLSPEQKAKPELMPITARLAGACHEVGLAADAYGVARDVLEGARTANDEPIQIEMLRLLAATAPDEEREAWSEAARAAEESTDYARYRRGGPRPNPVFNELYERLEEVYRN